MQSVILSIDDDNNVRGYVEKVLTDSGYIVHGADDGPQGLEMIEKLHPDLVLLDFHLPTINGESFLEQLKEQYPDLPVMMLTVENNPKQIASSLNNGAEDYLTKPFSPQELVARVRARLRSATSHGEEQELRVGDLMMNLSTHHVQRGKRNITLTPQEFKLLAFLMNHPNHVLSRDSILSRIWATSPEIETRVVDVYVGYLRKKIDKGFSHKLIQSVRGFGYMLKQPSE